MKKNVRAITALCLVFFISRCSKVVEISTETGSTTMSPSIIAGKWKLSVQKDTTFYSDYTDEFSCLPENLIYNFKNNGVLEIEYDGFVDSFSYKFISSSCMNVNWFGSPVVISTDTIVRLTSEELVFKYWITNIDDSKTKKVLYFFK